MAKHKKSKPDPRSADAAPADRQELHDPAAASGDDPDGERTTLEDSRRFGVGSYLLLNAIFLGFCAAQLVVVRVLLGEQKGLYFFFSLLAVSFFIVSVFDYFYDRHVDPVQAPSQ